MFKNYFIKFIVFPPLKMKEDNTNGELQQQETQNETNHKKDRLEFT